MRDIRWQESELPKNIPQGLKPIVSNRAFSARLKSCPFKTGLSPQTCKGSWLLSLAMSAALVGLAFASATAATTHKVHTVVLGGAKKVAYSKVGDPAGAATGEDTLRIRALLVDGVIKEWTTGDAHDVTDRSFVVRRVIKINDSLPEDTKKGGWVWQRGPWLLVDRVSGHIAALKLPDYDPGVSQVVWFRDYGAYCGVTATGKSLYAVVAQLAARKPALSKKLVAFTPESHQDPVCGATEWQREPLRVTFHPTGMEAIAFDLVPGSAVLVEDSADEPEAPAK